MEDFSTKSVLTNFIIMQNLFCVNRAFLIDNQCTKFLCYLIFVTIILTKAFIVIYDIFISEDSVDVSIQVLQICASLEVAYLAKCRCKPSFQKLDELDEKFCFNEVFATDLKKEVTKSILLVVISALFDSIAFVIDVFRPTVTLVFFIAASAHDSELKLYGLLIKVINLRLADLNKVPPHFGSYIYAHVLVATAFLSEDFTFEILMLLTATFVRLIIYSVYFVLFNTMSTEICIYMACRELKGLYSVWAMCSVAAETESICKQLTYDLVTKMAFDSKINKADTKSHQYRSVRRWFQSVKKLRPGFLTGTLLRLNMAITPQLVDLSINYLLIIVQIYVAFLVQV